MDLLKGLIGASLSELHTSVIALRVACVCTCVCLFACSHLVCGVTEVRNLVATRLDFSLINITWDEPQMPNGIVSYEVNVTGVDLVTQLNVLSETAVTNETQYSVEAALEVYALYVVMVTAMTGGGPAQTVVTNLTTPEGGKLTEQMLR